MTISVEHSTVYRYDYSVLLEPHTFRLRPRMTTTQLLLAFELQIEPQPLGATECLDQDGNLALYTWFAEQVRELKVVSRFRVQLLRDNPFDYVLRDPSPQLPLWYRDQLSAALAPYRVDAAVSEKVRQFANFVAAGAQWNSLAFLTNLNQELFQNCRHVTRPEGPPWTSDLTLSLRTGSCRDLAVLFCDVCRVMGIAARFVSGYECASAGQEQNNSYMHAWAEVYLPDAGWRGYDPSRGLVVSNTHVAVAAAFDHNLASPVSGLYSGWARSQMEATLKMQIGKE
jgi:transglutaminase-like putative cysteine protease